MRKLIRVLLVIGIVNGVSAQGDDRLINGKPADPKEWPSSVYASMSGSRCSATVVGERALLIAAHCVRNAGKASFSVGPNRYSSICTQSPDYNGNDTADWAICVTDKVVTGAAYEHVNSDANRIKVGGELTLSGYGCINPGGGGGNDGVYRIGTSKIIRVPNGNNHDIVTRTGAALCFGDSGGPAFLIDKVTNARWVVGVNSRGDISTTSYLSSLSSEASQQFLIEWADKNSHRICGVHKDAKGCRQTAE